MLFLEAVGGTGIIAMKTAGSERLRIDSNGIVCIAHTNALHSGNLQVSAAGADAIDINSYSTNANNGGRLSFYRSKNASIGSNTIVADGDSLGRIDFRGYNSNGDAYDQGATIEARVDGAVGSTTDMPTAIIFKTSGDGSANPDERLRIESNGRIAVGGFSGASNDLHIKTASSPTIILEDTTNTCVLLSYAQNSNAHVGTYSNHDLIFDTNSTERLRIKSNGAIGFGGENYGSSGQVLTSNGSGSSPTWQNPSGGGGGAVGVSTSVGTFTATPGSPSTIDTIDYTSDDVKVVEYTLHFTNGSDIQAQKLLVMQDNTNAFSNEYAIMSSSTKLVSVDAEISGDNVLVRATPETGVSGSTTFRWRREVQT